MIEGRNVAAVVPAYNEARLVRRTLDAIPEFVDRVIVVDDASTDDTAGQARRAARPIDLIRHQANLGVGAAIASGCQAAQRDGVDFVVVIAADGQMAPEDLPNLLQPLAVGNADFVKGNRLDWPGARARMPLHRWFGNHVLSALTRLALGVPWRDSQCGYVAMNRRVLEGIDWSSLWSGYGYPNDLLAELARRGAEVREVLVRPVYADERSGIRPWHVFVTMPFVIARACLRTRFGGAIRPEWPTSTSSTATPMASVHSRSSATQSHERALSSRA